MKVKKQFENNDLFSNWELVGWMGITDGDKDVPYTPTTKKQVLDIAGLANLLVSEYLEVVAQQKTKN